MSASGDGVLPVPKFFEYRSVEPESLRDRHASVLSVVEQLSCVVEELSAGVVVCGVEGFSVGRLRGESSRKGYVRRAVRSPGQPQRDVVMMRSQLVGWVQEAAKQVIALAMHLPDPGDQAAVLTSVGNAVQGALMQLAVDATERAAAEMDCGADPERPGYAVVDPEQVAADIVAVEQQMSCRSAGKFVYDAVELFERLPRVWNLITDGVMPKWVGDIIARETRHVTDHEVLAQIEVAMLNRWGSGRSPGLWSGYQTRVLRDLVAQFDPQALAKKVDDNERERDVSVRDDEPGMAAVTANLPLLDAESVMASLNALADTWAGYEGETRSVGQRRADALVQLTTGIDKNPPGFTTSGGASDNASDNGTDNGSDNGGGSGGGLRVRVEPRLTVLADGEVPEQLRRVWTGLSSTARAKLDALLAGCEAAKIEVLPIRSGCDAAVAAQVAAQIRALARQAAAEMTYQPSAALRRAVIERDGTCRHPGCSVPARRCDLDHVRPFNHANPAAGGLTREDNLMCLCRKHHRGKTHGNVSYTLHPDGRVTARIGESCTADSVPHGPRGAVRADRGLTYTANHNAELRELLAAVKELEHVLTAPPAVPTPPAEAPRPEPTKATKRRRATHCHRARTAAAINKHGLGAVRGDIEGLTHCERRKLREHNIPPTIEPVSDVDRYEDPPF